MGVSPWTGTGSASMPGRRLKRIWAGGGYHRPLLSRHRQHMIVVAGKVEIHAALDGGYSRIHLV